MKKMQYLIGIMIFLSMQSISGQDGWEEYKGYDITEEGGIPVIKVWGNNTTIPLYSIPIDDNSLLSEYVMARLLNVRKGGLIVKFIDGTPKRYQFKYLSDVSTSRETNELEAIGFYENGSGSIFLEVYLVGIATPTLFELTAGASPKAKLKFDYMIAALVDYYTTPSTDDTPEILKTGATPIGIRFKMRY